MFRSIANRISLLKHSPLRNSGEKSYVFIHINKTGGSSISQHLGFKKILHLTAQEVIDWIGREKWDSAETFAVVRNPWDKVASHYLFRVKTNQTRLSEQPLDFNDWILKTYGKNKDPFYYDKPKMFMPQSDWLKDDAGNVAVKHLLRFEKLEEEFNDLSGLIGLEPGLPHLNRTTEFDYKSMYNPESKEVIANWFAEDIDRFQYTFDHENI